MSRADGDAENSAAESAAARATKTAQATTTSTANAKQSGDSNRIEAFAEPYRDIAIAASEMGTLSSVNVKEGDVLAFPGEQNHSYQNTGLRRAVCLSVVVLAPIGL